MRRIVLLASVVAMTSVSAFAMRPAGPDLRVYGGMMDREVVLRDVRPATKTIQFDLAHLHESLYVGPRTWIFKDHEEATFADLHDGQRVHVWYVPLGGQAVVIEVLPRTSEPGVTGGGPNVASPGWVDAYYRNPQPDRFVAEVRARSKSGKLSAPKAAPPMVAFLSRVMADNPEKIAVWMAALADLPESDKETLHKAIWLSRTTAGKAYLEKEGLLKYLAQPAADILKLPIESPAVLDMLWGYFFATGDEAPIRRIVSAANYYPSLGALERYKTSARTEADARQAQKEVIFRAAMWSLGSNCRQHRRVKEICDKLLEGGDLNPTERNCLKTVLANLNNSTRPGPRG
jgi:hypothetical protein